MNEHDEQQEGTRATTEPDARDAEQRPDTDAVPEPDMDDRATRRYAETRTRLKAVTAERDALAERVTVHRRADVERVAARHLSDPALVWDNGLTLDDVLDEAGDVDGAAVEEAVAAIAQRLRGALPPPAHHMDLGPKATVAQRNSTWAGVFKGSR